MHLPTGTGEWQPILTGFVAPRAGVYAVRMVESRTRRVRPISRFLDVDPDGILCLGQSSDSLERRRRQFIMAVRERYMHSEGNLLNIILSHADRRQKLFVNAEHTLGLLEWFVEYTRFARKREETLIKHYILRFGEVPPLNSVIPDRYNARSWITRVAEREGSLDSENEKIE